jgi:hypothetical protein
MKRNLTLLILLLLVFFVFGLGQAGAISIALSGSASGSASVLYEGNVTYDNDIGWSAPLWIDYHLHLETAGTFFSDAIFSPARVDLTGLPANPKATKLYSWGTLTLSADKKSLWFDFDTPIADGDIFGVHVPIEGLGQYTSFKLSQYASPIPEPATMLLLGSGLIGLAGVGRKKYKK